MNEQSDSKQSESGDSDTDTDSTRGPGFREINYQHSSSFVPILEHLGCSLLVSTYAAGKLVSVGAHDGRLNLGFNNFQTAMGVAIGPQGLAVGGPNLIWFLRDATSLCSRIEPVGHFDGGFLTRESFVTGNIHVHEMDWGESGELWLVNTLFSTLCTLHEDFSFVPRWHPSFISCLLPDDRCHLNGMAMVQGQPKYVTALGASDRPHGWRDTKLAGGIIMDVESGDTIASGFCMPHSPRVHQGKLYVLDSGRGNLLEVDPGSGEQKVIADYPGYGRGLSFCGQFAFVGMSRARETSMFGGVPICEDRSKMRCGVAVIDLLSEQAVAFLEFQSGVEELFDVQVLAGTRNPMICGPYSELDQQSPVWVVPAPDRISGLRNQSNIGTVSRRRPSNSSLD